MKPSLEDRLRKSVAAAKPNSVSLAPGKQHKQVDVEQLPDIMEAVSSVADRMKVLRLVSQAIELQAQESAAKKARSPIIQELKEIIRTKSTYPSFMVDGARVSTFSSPRRSISKEKLMEHGVSPATIAACTVETQSLSLKITAPGSNDDDD